MSSYDSSRTLKVPPTIAYYVNRLSSFSRNRVKLSMFSATQCEAGNAFTVTLPINNILDLDSLALFFTSTISGATAGKLGYQDGTDLIHNVSIYINNELKDSHPYFNQTVKSFKAYQADSRQSVAKLLSHNYHFPNNYVTTDTSDNLTAWNDANGKLVSKHAIQAWEMLGFIASAQPRILDTMRTGEVKIEFQLATSDIFATNGLVTGSPTFKLTDLEMQVDVLQFDPIYDQMVSEVMAGGSPLVMPFTKYTWNLGSPQQLDQAQLNFFVSSQSLDGVLATVFYDGTAAAGKWKSKELVGVGSNQIPSYFVKGHANLTGSELRLNQVLFPAYGRVNMESAAVMALNALIPPDATGGNFKLDGLEEFRKAHYFHVQKLNYNSDGHTLSGVDTRGVNYQGQVTFYGGAGYVVPAVLLLSTSTLNILDGRQVQVIN